MRGGERMERERERETASWQMVLLGPGGAGDGTRFRIILDQNSIASEMVLLPLATGLFEEKIKL